MSQLEISTLLKNSIDAKQNIMYLCYLFRVGSIELSNFCAIFHSLGTIVCINALWFFHQNGSSKHVSNDLVSPGDLNRHSLHCLCLIFMVVLELCV